MGMEGEFEGVPARVLKGDGCSSNVISREFAELHRSQFTFQPTLMNVSHSNQGSREIATKMVVNGTVTLGNYAYKENLIIADARYDVSLGMPWHVDAQPETDYNLRIVSVDGNSLSCRATAWKGFCTVETLGVKKCRRKLRRLKKGTQLFRLVQASSSELQESIPKVWLLDYKDEELQEILKKYKEVFQTELPPGLPPNRSVDHAMETDLEARQRVSTWAWRNNFV